MKNNHRNRLAIAIAFLSTVASLAVGTGMASAELSSRTAPELARVLEEHAETDKNKDGFLTFDEYDAFFRTQGEKKPANPLSMEVNNGDLLVTEFEENNLGKWRQWGWKIEGQSFNHDLNRGTKLMKRRAGAFGGRFLLTSYSETEPQTGRILSPEFELKQPYVVFLISGGELDGSACVNLLIDQKAVRSASGHNDDRFEKVAFDVSAFQGRKAQIEIVDEHHDRALWGHINVDSIYQSKNAGNASRILSESPRATVSQAGLILTAANTRSHGPAEIKEGTLRIGDSSISAHDLLLAIGDPAAKRKASGKALHLRNGEIWSVDRISFEAGKLSIQSNQFRSREVPVASVARLDFGAPTPTAGNVAPSEPGSLLRTNGDPIPGKLIWVRDKDIAIDCALGIVPVPREFAISFEFPKPRIRGGGKISPQGDEIALTDGSLLFGTIEFENERLIVKHETLGDLKLPWQSVRHIRRAGGDSRVAWLDLAASTVLSRNGPGLPPPLPLVIDSRDASHLRAIRLMPQTSIRYKIPSSDGSSRRFLRAELAPISGGRADLAVRVLHGDAVLWERAITPKENLIPISVELPTTVTDTLTIEVHFAGRPAFPCGVDWRDAHVLSISGGATEASASNNLNKSTTN